MKLISTLVALGLLLTACSSSMSDSAIRRQLVGAWVLDSGPAKVIENKADGTVVTKINGVETARGTWRIKNGYFIAMPAKSSSKAFAAQAETNKVLHVTSDEAILLSIDGRTPMTFHKR